MSAYASLVYAARVLMSTLLEQGDKIDAVQADLRKAIATLAIPDEQELKKLARYRKLLEEASSGASWLSTSSGSSGAPARSPTRRGPPPAATG